MIFFRHIWIRIIHNRKRKVYLCILQIEFDLRGAQFNKKKTRKCVADGARLGNLCEFIYTMYIRDWWTR